MILDFSIISNYIYFFEKEYIALAGILELIVFTVAHEDPASILLLNFPNERLK